MSPCTARASSKISKDGLLHTLRDKLNDESLDALTAGIHQDCQDACAYFASPPK